MTHTGQKLAQFEFFTFDEPKTVKNIPHIDPKNLKQEGLDVGIKKHYTRVHRTRDPNELREFKNYCVFSLFIEICCVFSVLITHT